MEKKNKISLLLTVIVCLLPIILGIALYNKLPEQMPIHFTINDEIDNYAPKNFALFVMPTIMAVVQAIVMLISIKNVKEYKKPKAIKLFEWFIPIVTVLVYIIMIEVALGSTVYVGKSVCLVLGILFAIIGNYLPKMSYEVGKNVFHPMPKDEKTFRKISKIMGYSFIIMAIILLILVFFV